MTTLPPLPAGFVLDAADKGPPPLPDGFVLDAAPSPAPAAAPIEVKPNLSSIPIVGPALAAVGFNGNPQQAAPAEPYEESYTSQGLSGLNEGIAAGLGFPVELANAGLKAGVLGVNALTGSDFKASDSPFMGQDFFRELLSPTIAPATDDQGKQVLRRVAQEVGATLVPGMGLAGKAAAPLKTLAADIGAATTSGLGAAAGQQLAPDNPIAELVGQIAGGLTPMGLAKAFNGAKAKFVTGAPSTEELQAMKSAAYQAVDKAGASYTPASVDALISGMEKAAKASNISPTRHSAPFSLLQDIRSRGTKPYTLTELDQLRQEIGMDLLSSPAASDRFFGKMFVTRLDDFIEKTPLATLVAANSPNSAVMGNAVDVSDMITTARMLNQRYKKAEKLDLMGTKAENNAAVSGSGGNINNAIRQQVKTILNDPKAMRGFFPDELELMNQIVKGTAGQNALRKVGKVSPNGNGLMSMLGIMGTAQNPSFAAVPLIGTVAKAFADGMTRSRFDLLKALVTQGRPVPRGMTLTDLDKEVLSALSAGQAANYTETTSAGATVPASISSF